MNTLFVILLVLAMAATIFAFVRGIVAFLKTTETDLNSMDSGPSQSSLKQNRAMMQRIMFQGVAVVFVIILLIAAGNK